MSPAFNDGTTTIQKLDNISWASGEVKCTINNQPAAITETVKPVALDGAAPKRWYQFALDQKRYWVTENGFHVNGVDDAFGIKKLPGYLFATYWPLAGGAGSGIDAFGFVVPDGEQPTLMYGAIYSAPTFSKDGRIIFNDLRLFGDLPPDRTPVDRSRALMADPAGYFLVQTAAGRYDMVSAKDGKSWITWVF